MLSASGKKLGDSDWNISEQTLVSNWLMLQHSGSLTSLLPKPILFTLLPEVAKGQFKPNSHTTRNFLPLATNPSPPPGSRFGHWFLDLERGICQSGRKSQLRTASSASFTFSDETFLAFCQVATYTGKQLPQKASQSPLYPQWSVCPQWLHNISGWGSHCPAC